MLPECQYQFGGEQKSLVAITEATGTEAVAEAAFSTPVAYSHELCTVCAKCMSAGILSALQNYNVG